MDTDYLRSLKIALSGAARCPLVFVCNFEVESQWARHHVGLPSPTLSSSTALVRRMEELGVLLAGADDVLILKQPLDPGYRAYLERLGFALPRVLTPENTTPDEPTARDALNSPRLLAELTALATAGARLLPMGVSAVEEELALACGLPLAVPGEAVFERVNGKIYSRRLVEAAGLRPVPGACCETVEEFAAVLAGYRTRLDAGERIVVKDSFGVSGKGLVVLDKSGKADRLAQMAARRATRSGDPRLEVVVEEWLPKRFDLNYQVTVSQNGEVNLDFVKQAITENGVHKGHIMPAELTPAQRTEIDQAAHEVGRRLYADGFFGVLGVDAIVGSDDTVYPVLEINARLNMSTYQGSLTELMQPPGHVGLARQYSLRMGGALTFGELSEALGDVLDRGAHQRFVVTCFGTLNANSHQQPPYEGRLYALLIAANHQLLAELDTAAQTALDKLPVGKEDR